METIKRSECCICGSKDFESALEISQFPVLMGTTKQDESLDLFHDLKWALCSKCGCIQLLDLIPLEVLYSEQHSAGAIGEIWQTHHQEFADFILKEQPKSVCEIGSAHGRLSQIILDSRPDLEYTIIEPSPVNIDRRVNTVIGIAEDNLHIIAQNEIVVHSHVLEHVYYANKFLFSLSNSMSLGSSMFISFPNIQELIETGGSNALNFEHTYYLDPSQLQCLLRNHGFTVEKEHNYLRHSYFLHVKKDSNENVTEFPLENIREKSLSFVKMWQTLTEFVTHANLAIKAEPIPTFIFGAHVFSQALISMGLNIERIEGVLDNSEGKVGQRLYGTSLTVSNPRVIQGLDEVRVVLKASHYQEEIKKQLMTLNPNVQIFE